jgi:hypothetical protein
MPAALYTVAFDGANQAREVRVQPFALDPDAPRYRRDLPLWPGEEEATAMADDIAALSRPFGTQVAVRDGVAVATIK